MVRAFTVLAARRISMAAVANSGQSSAWARCKCTWAGRDQAWWSARIPLPLPSSCIYVPAFDYAEGPRSFRIHETDFNDCTLACRDAPCGCVTAPRFSLRGGMGSGISANAALPLFLRAFLETCFTLSFLKASSISLQTSIERIPNTKRPGTFWVPGPLA